MTPEGMVHALNEIHRLLAPGGCLIDIHPVAELPMVEVHRGSEVLFTAENPDYGTEGFMRADKALKNAVRRRKFSLKQRGLFDFFVYAPSTNELNDYIELQDAYDTDPDDEGRTPQEEELLAQIDDILRDAGAESEVATHEHVHITQLLPIK